MFNWKSLVTSSLLLALGTAKNEETRGATIGIDLGTTYSCVAVWKGGNIEIAANNQGFRTTPSWIALTEENDFIIGDAAKNQAARNPINTIFDAKRMIGRTNDDKSVAKDIEHWPFKVEFRDNKPLIVLKNDKGTKKMAPEEVSAKILTYMKETAESYLGTKVTHAVITVPAYFNDAQRQATKDAGLIAGLHVDRILNEPTAAAMAYGLDKKSKKEQKIVVFDLGGGTFDVSLLVIEDGVYEVKAVNGDTHLGGQDFDNNVVDHLVKVIKEKHNKDFSSDERARAKLRAEAEKAKRALSSSLEVTIIIDGFLPEGKDFVQKFTRAQFEDLNKSLFKKTIKPVKQALEDAKWKISDVEEIVLVGGSTRIPKVRELLQEFFNGKELNYSVNPDEAVAYGAAVQAGVLSGEKKTEDVLVIDVTPLSLGIETVNGIMTNLISRNTSVPVKKTQIFSTASDNQPSVEIKIYEGERAMAKDNHPLGNFNLAGIPLAPRGVPQIEVTFEIDANGILTVTAQDKGTGNKHSINITADNQRLSPEEIQRMVDDAEKFRKSDQEKKERVEARADLENYLLSITSQVGDKDGLGAKVDEDAKKSIQSIVSEKLSWMEENKESASKEDYEEQKAEVEKAFAPILSSVYGQKSGAQDDDDESSDEDL